MDYNGEQLPFYEGFENINFSSPEWISNIGNWFVTDEVSYNGSYCLKFKIVVWQKELNSFGK